MTGEEAAQHPAFGPRTERRPPVRTSTSSGAGPAPDGRTATSPAARRPRPGSALTPPSRWSRGEGRERRAGFVEGKRCEIRRSSGSPARRGRASPGTRPGGSTSCEDHAVPSQEVTGHVEGHRTRLSAQRTGRPDRPAERERHALGGTTRLDRRLGHPPARALAHLGDGSPTDGRSSRRRPGARPARRSRRGSSAMTRAPKKEWSRMCPGRSDRSPRPRPCPTPRSQASRGVERYAERVAREQRTPRSPSSPAVAEEHVVRRGKVLGVRARPHVSPRST